VFRKNSKCSNRGPFDPALDSFYKLFLVFLWLPGVKYCGRWRGLNRQPSKPQLDAVTYQPQQFCSVITHRDLVTYGQGIRVSFMNQWWLVMGTSLNFVLESSRAGKNCSILFLLLKKWWLTMTPLCLLAFVDLILCISLCSCETKENKSFDPNFPKFIDCMCLSKLICLLHWYTITSIWTG